MKILLVGPRSEFMDGVRRAFINEHHWVTYIDERGLRRFPPLWRFIRDVPFLRRASNSLLGSYIRRRARAFKPDLALMVKGTSVKEDTLRRLRAMNIPIANWFPENGLREPYRSWLETHIGLYDHFFCFDSALLEKGDAFPRARLSYLPLGADPESFQTGDLSAEDHARYDADICFVGAWYPDRENVLSTLSGYRMKIFGWKGWEQSSLAYNYGGPLNSLESAKAYRCAKIVINMNLQPPVSGVNGKTFEICAAGGFQLTDFRSDLPALYDIGLELAVFHSPEELAGLVRHFLDNPAAREQIAKAGNARTLRDHTLGSRVSNIVSTVC